MDIKPIIKHQYHAALTMLKMAIEQCPESAWNDPEYKNASWHIVYHTLFYTHLYLQVSEKEFKPWSKHREEYPFMGGLPLGRPTGLLRLENLIPKKRCWSIVNSARMKWKKKFLDFRIWRENPVFGGIQSVNWNFNSTISAIFNITPPSSSIAACDRRMI